MSAAAQMSFCLSAPRITAARRQHDGEYNPYQVAGWQNSSKSSRGLGRKLKRAGLS